MYRKHPLSYFRKNGFRTREVAVSASLVCSPLWSTLLPVAYRPARRAQPVPRIPAKPKRAIVLCTTSNPQHPYESTCYPRSPDWCLAPLQRPGVRFDRLKDFTHHGKETSTCQLPCIVTYPQGFQVGHPRTLTSPHHYFRKSTSAACIHHWRNIYGCATAMWWSVLNELPPPARSICAAPRIVAGKRESHTPCTVGNTTSYGTCPNYFLVRV